MGAGEMVATGCGEQRCYATQAMGGSEGEEGRRGERSSAVADLT